jgi:uncharacterized membrane protein HdeD (DUF308 family)
MSEPITSPETPGHRSRWRWFLVAGLVLLVLGVIGIGATALIERATILLFGPLLLASSFVQVLTGLFAGRGKERLLHYVAAGPEAILGFFIMARPVEGLGTLIAVIAILLMLSGLARLVWSWELTSRHRVWAILAGVIALLLGISIWVGPRSASLWFVGLCLAIDFLCHGASWSAMSLAEQKRQQTQASEKAVADLGTESAGLGSPGKR